MKPFGIAFVALAVACLAIVTFAHGQDEKSEDPTQLFYTGNHYYKSQDYLKAVEQYLKILDMGIENGPLYYNIGNGFLKLGKVGYAILCYEKAKRLMPHDSDLKANLAYAKSLTDESAAEEQRRNIFTQAIRRMYSDVSLGAIAAITLITYIALLGVLAICVVRPILGRRLGFLAIIIAIVLFFNGSAFAVRYYGEIAAKYGIVVERSVEAKFEPIDKSTTYYTLKEGTQVRILKTKEGWRRVKRYDGKAGWVKKEAVEEI